MPLSEAQRERFALQFLMFDKDSDGRIATEQLGSLLRVWGFCPTEAEVRTTVRLLDPDGTGFIDKAQAFSAAESMQHCVVTEVEVCEALRVLDTDGDGFLTTAELRHILLNLGAKLTAEEVNEIIADVYVDDEHQIAIEELGRLLFVDAPEGKMEVLERF